MRIQIRWRLVKRRQTGHWERHPGFGAENHLEVAGKSVRRSHLDGICAAGQGVSLM
ncbi:MAG TPA: hypothetical protein VMG63_20310 [Terriglobia bacterium]|nr:hypothetical protein [Terriglobia bacterium]